MIAGGCDPVVTPPPRWSVAAYLKASIASDGDQLGFSVALAGDTLVAGAPGESAGGVAYVFRRSGAGWRYETFLRGSGTDDRDDFGHGVALSGDTIAVGAWNEESGGDSAGAVYVFRWSGTQWQQEARLEASNIDAGDRFGWSVALAGDTLAVGATHEDSAATDVDGDEQDDDAEDSGAVYVFRRSGAQWQQEAYLKASNTDNADRFGHAVTLAGDTLAVGAVGEDSAATGVDADASNDSAVNSGAVYVFQRNGSAWARQAYLKAGNTDAADQFGYSVQLAGDTLAIGAPYEDSAASGVGGDQHDDDALDSGAVYVFQRSGTRWQQTAYVKASDPGVREYFGHGVALDGDTLAVGATRAGAVATDAGDQVGSGAVYVFRRSGVGWRQEAQLEAPNADPGDELGHSVALDGDTLAIGARYEDSAATGVDGDQANDDAADSGAVYVSVRDAR